MNPATRISLIYYFTALIVAWLYMKLYDNSPAPVLVAGMTNEESMLKEIIRAENITCPNCYPSAHEVPTCGTDGRTYQNPGILYCANKCDRKILIASMGRCPETDPLEPEETTKKP